jgi:hypothetical protein
MNSIGGNGKYCGDNDAQLGRINAFHHEASSGKYVPSTVLFEPDTRHDQRCARVAARAVTGRRATSEGLSINRSDPPLQKG